LTTGITAIMTTAHSASTTPKKKKRVPMNKAMASVTKTR
jgi:hypothetical protein